MSWVLFPLVLAALCLGWGILLRAVPGVRIPRAVVPGAGMASIVVAGQALTYADATAELATPVIAGVGVIGLSVGAVTRLRPPQAWALAAAGATFGIFAAPTVLSGEATFAGFIKLDDTATWLALTDRIMEHGRSLEGLAPSTYEATLVFNLGDGYPVGVFVPLGVGAAIVGEDPAWVIQPYMAFWAALLSLALWRLGRRVVADHRLRALAAFVGAQAALLYGYYLWGGVKEVAAIALVATTAALLAPATSAGPVRSVMPAALSAAALVGVLSGGGALWLAPVLGFGLFVCVRVLGWPGALRRAAAFAGVVVAAALPVLAAGGLLPPTSSPLTDGAAVGNLGGPLNLWQLAGVWPAGDFRSQPDAEIVAYALAATAALCAAACLAYAWRRRAWWVLAFAGGTLVAAAAIALVGSPWVDGKAYAIASVVVPFAAILGAGALWADGRRAVAGVLGALVAGGVLWSNALQYGGASLAPRDQLAELERVGELVAGEGPTLMTEYNPFGARHFLREGDPEGVSELRRRQIPLAGGGAVRKGRSADTDELAADDLLVYRSLVLRRSPVRSRPPSPYQLAWAGEHYELWQRRGGTSLAIERLPLGSEHDPTGVASCAQVRELARAARGGELLAVRRARPTVVSLGDDLEAVVQAEGIQEAWLRGSVRGEATLVVDGQSAGTAGHVLNNDGGYLSLAEVDLEGGSSTASVRLGGSDLHPGSGGPQAALGPLVLGPSRTDLEPVSTPRGEWRRLCGERLDWVEAVSR
jgi:hypothetical protein